MTESLPRLLLRLSEAGEPAILWGRQAAPYTGRDFDRLLELGVLVEEAPAADWDVCAECECGLDVRPVQEIGGRPVAACPLDSGSDLALDTDDLRCFRIDPPALLGEIAAATGFDGEPSMFAPAVWRMGQIPPRRTLYIAFDRAALMQLGLLSAIRAADDGASVSLAGPLLSIAEQLRFREAGVDLVELSAALAEGRDAGLALNLAALEPRSPGSRLLVRSAAGMIAMDGIDMALPHQPFRLFKALAEKTRAEGAFMSAAEIETLTGREARDIVRELRNSLATAGIGADQARALIETKRGRGWRLVLRPFNVVVEP